MFNSNTNLLLTVQKAKVNCNFYIILIFILFACNEIKRESGEKIPLARINKEYLYLNDIKHVLPPGLSKQDCLQYIKHYAESWTKKKIIVRIALSKLSSDKKMEIEEKVTDYRNSLVVSEFERLLMEEIDTQITLEQLKNYYDSNKKDFLLKQTLVKAILLQLPADAPKLEKIRNILQNKTINGITELKSYCHKYAHGYHLSYDEWIDIDRLFFNSSFKELISYVKNSVDRDYFEIRKDNTIIMLKIIEKRYPLQIAPFDYVKELIKSLILNERKIQLITNFEQKVYTKAKNEKEVEIFVH
jgi:hypothetical protein